MRPLALKNLVVLITGATSGIGRAAALCFAAQGAHLLLIARDEARLKEVAAHCDGLLPQNLKSQISNLKSLPLAGDVSDPQTMQRAVSLAVETWGRADVLINNAGIGQNLPLEKMSWQQIERILETNINGTLHGIRAALPQMKKQAPVEIGGRLLRGQIINISSVLAFSGVPHYSVYCATKSALRALSQSLRHELRPDNIEVLAVYPGTTDTEFFQRAYTDGRPWLIELRRTMSAERVAAAILRASIKHRRETVLTAEGRLFALGVRFFPRLTDWGTGLVYSAHRKKQNEPAVRGR